MNAVRNIDFSKPAVIDFDDISGPEMDLFAEATGGEFWPFAEAVRSGAIPPEEFLSGKNRRAVYALAWIYFRREQPGLKFEQVYSRGIGQIGVTLEGLREEFNTNKTATLAPINRNTEPPNTVTPWQNR